MNEKVSWTVPDIILYAMLGAAVILFLVTLLRRC